MDQLSLIAEATNRLQALINGTASPAEAGAVVSARIAEGRATFTPEEEKLMLEAINHAAPVPEEEPDKPHKKHK